MVTEKVIFEQKFEGDESIAMEISGEKLIGRAKSAQAWRQVHLLVLEEPAPG